MSCLLDLPDSGSNQGPARGCRAAAGVTGSFEPPIRERGRIRFRESGARTRSAPLTVSDPAYPCSRLLATDGAGPALDARRMSSLLLIRAHEPDMEHGYKEISIRPMPRGRHRMDPPCAAHLAARQVMCRAAETADGSFTATFSGHNTARSQLRSFAEPAPPPLNDSVRRVFPDARESELMPDRLRKFKISRLRISRHGCKASPCPIAADGVTGDSGARPRAVSRPG